jgi:hypothetical protein
VLFTNWKQVAAELDQNCFDFVCLGFTCVHGPRQLRGYLSSALLRILDALYLSPVVATVALT